MLKKLRESKSTSDCKMRFKPLFVLLLLILTACGGAKVDSPKAIEKLATKEVVSFHNAAFPEYETLAGRMRLAYETDGSGQRVSVTYRMKKDEIIWAKASILGITIAKVYITPTSVSYYETIGRTYFEGDFSLLSDWLGTPIDFQQTQNLLLGQSIFPLSPQNYTSELFKGTFKIEPKKQPQNFIHSLFLNPANFKIVSATVSQPDYNRFLNVQYKDYQNIEGRFFPTNISIVNTEETEQTKIEINYRKIDLNVNINFPFEIPSGYKQIKL